MIERPRITAVRTLGRPGASTRAPEPKRTKASQETAERAKRQLRAEFRKAMALKTKLADEAATHGPDKGRDPKLAETLRSIVASLEGMSRFAIAMGILTPAENRAIWTSYIKRGLYEGWR